MADNGGADPVNNNNNTTVASEGTIIKVTVKTPKDKEEIAISEDASVTQVGSIYQYGTPLPIYASTTSCPGTSLACFPWSI